MTNSIYIQFFYLFRLDADSVVTTFRTTESTVTHIDVDEFVHVNIIFSDYNVLKTTDGNYTYNVVGKATQQGYVEDVGTVARFKFIHSFLQISTNLVLITDNRNHCVGH